MIGPKICRDCRWCRYPGDRASPCFHEDALKPAVDFVSGETRPPPVTCAAMRSPVAGRCGVWAKLFEPRKGAA